MPKVRPSSYKRRLENTNLTAFPTAFAKDLLTDPSTRNVNDVHHVVQAAASSTSADRAKSFLSEIGVADSAKAYGTYKELVADPDVDIVYVATPHSHHYQNTRLCLEAGKHVLLEKAFTTNAEQAKILVDIARQRGLFLMEAQWTRYFPIAVKIRKMIAEGKLGDVRRVIADNSFGNNVEEEFPTSSRMVNLDLAGGALLDRKAHAVFLLALAVLTRRFVLQSESTRSYGTFKSCTTSSPKTGRASQRSSPS